MDQKIVCLGITILAFSWIIQPVTSLAVKESTIESNTSSSQETSTAESTIESNTSSSQETSTAESTIESNTSSSQETSTAESTIESNTKVRLSEERSVEVSNWTEFVKAYNNEEVRQIKVNNDIRNDNRTNIKERTVSIDIDGRNHVFDMQNASLRIKAFDTGSQTFSVRNIKKVISTRSTVSGFISNERDTATGNSGWTINVSNITSDKSMRTRLVTSLGSQLNLSGKITWYTASEMAQVSGVRIENNAEVVSFKANAPENRSFFWFADSTGRGVGSKEFVVGKNAKANFKMGTGGTAYPVVFAYYDRIHLEDGATYNATMPGNAFRADYAKGSDFIADGNNKINLTSLSKGNSTIYFNGTDRNKKNSFKIGPHSELYVISATNTPLFQTGGNDNKNREVIIEAPKILDLRNYSGSQSISQSSIALKNLGLFRITDSDVSLWNLPSDVNKKADFTFTKINYLNQVNGVVSSDNKQLEKVFNTENKRRISASNQKPSTEWQKITDADKKLSTRVKIGEFPDSKGMDDQGNIHYNPVYASKGEAMVDIVDTKGIKHSSILTDDQGYATYTSPEFQEAGKEVSSIATRGPWKQEKPSTTKVIDITPPDPAKINEVLTPNSKQITGSGEPNAIITLTVNDKKEADIKGVVDKKGDFSLDISDLSLKENDVVQIFLQDHSGKADIPDRPYTNNDIGNIEPKVDFKFRDRIFKAATKLQVQGILKLSSVPSSINFGNNVKLSSDTLHLKGEKVGDLIVSDTRGIAKKTDWSLSLKEKKTLIGQGGTVNYINRKNESIEINDKEQPIEHNLSDKPEEEKISDDWQQSSHGLFLNVSPEAQKIGKYSGILSWTLQDTPTVN